MAVSRSRTQPHVVAVACTAMATRFEVVVWGRGESRARAAGEEALTEVQRLDAQLSRFSDTSDIYEINAVAAFRPVRVEPRIFRLLERAAALSAETDGAFDPTVGPLMGVWGFTGGSGRVPDAEELAAARDLVGMSYVRLDPEGLRVSFDTPGVSIDLGAFGKGYAVEQAAVVLRECGVGGALIHGGTSTACAVGRRPDGSPWEVEVRDPAGAEAPLATVHLADRSLSVSAPHGRAFTADGRTYGHVIDPRTGSPAMAAALAAVASASPADADALSTALLVLGPGAVEAFGIRRPADAALVAEFGPDGALAAVATGPL